MRKLETSILNCIAQDPTTSLSNLVALISEEQNVSESEVHRTLKSLERDSLVLIDKNMDMIMLSLKGSSYIEN